MFYSINSPHDSLSKQHSAITITININAVTPCCLAGLDLAPRLLHRTAVQIKSSFPSVNSFCTLSPIPGFMGYLKSIGNRTVGY